MLHPQAILQDIYFRHVVSDALWAMQAVVINRPVARALIGGVEYSYLCVMPD